MEENKVINLDTSTAKELKAIAYDLIGQIEQMTQGFNQQTEPIRNNLKMINASIVRKQQEENQKIVEKKTERTIIPSDGKTEV